MKHKIVGMLLFLAIPSFAVEDQNVIRDGTFWSTLTQTEKYAYVTGFLDGITWGEVFIAQRSHDYKNILNEEDNFFAAKKATQLASEVDVFYEDSKNTKIRVNLALPLVVDKIDGMPEDKLKKFIENARQKATQHVTSMP